MICPECKSKVKSELLTTNKEGSYLVVVVGWNCPNCSFYAITTATAPLLAYDNDGKEVRLED